MIYKIHIDKESFYGIGQYMQKLDYPPIPKKVIKALQSEVITIPLIQVQIYNHYDLVTNFQYVDFLSTAMVNSHTSMLKDLTLNYSYTERDLLEITNNDYIDFFTTQIILLLLAEKVNNQQLCLYHYLNDEIDIDILAVLINEMTLICTEIILYPKDNENKDANNVIIHNRNDYPIKPRKKVDINLHISEKELIDKFFIMENIIEAKKLIKKL